MMALGYALARGVTAVVGALNAGVAQKILNAPTTALQPIGSAGGRARGYRGAAEKHLQLLMAQAAWMTAITCI